MLYKRINDTNLKQTIDSTYKKIDYSIKKFDRRLKLVNNLLKDDFIDIVDEFYRTQSLNPNHLAEDYELINKLHNIATYLISAEDVESSSKLENKFHNDSREFQKAENKSITYSDTNDLENNFNINTDNKNYKLDKNFTMNNLKTSELRKKEFISDYLDFLKYLKDNKLRYSKVSTKEVENDILLLAKRHAIIFKAPLPDSYPKLDLDLIDISDIDTIKMLLKIPRKELNYLNDFDLILDEFYTTLDNTPLKENELEIIELLQDFNYQTEVAEVLGTTKQNLNASINTICKKIQNQYFDDLEDYIYTYKAKGRYKKCTKCGEVKLISKFGVDKKNKDGYKARCKDCISKKRH